MYLNIIFHLIVSAKETMSGCCSPLSICSPQSGFQFSRKRCSQMASVGLLHESWMSPENEEMLDNMGHISAVGAYVEARNFLDPTLVGAQELALARSKLGDVARSHMVKSFSVSLIGEGRSLSTTFIS